MRGVSWGFLILFALVGVRLIQVHTTPDMELTAEERAHIGEIDLHIPRGPVVDADGGLLAADRQVFSLWANPRAVIDPDMTAMALCGPLGLDEAEIVARVTRRDRSNRPMKFVWIKRWLDERELRVFDTLDSSLKSGLELKKESVRYYPEGELAAHVMGLVNRDGAGCGGIEMAYDKYLRSTPGRHRTRVDARREPLRSLTLAKEEPGGGGALTLTIDKSIQRTLERELDKGMLTSEAPRGMGIVVDVKTGAILAMACRPAYDPNVHGDVSDERYRNRALEFAFEPGSSFKLVTASGALEQALVTPETIIDCENGSFNPYGHRIRDFHRLGVIPFSHCFQESSNIAIIKVGAMLGPERLEHWISRFGFGRRACLDFPLESQGIFRPRSKWSRLSMGSLPMGQEIAVTMPQLARAFCVIANGGYLRHLYVVERATAPDGTVVYQHEAEPADRILSEATVNTMQQLCHLVVLHGTGKPANIPEFRVGGKTGTAQIAAPGGRGFLPGKFTAIFAGFAPIADPQICSIIIIQEPGIRLHYGGSVCGPVFKEVVRDALTHRNCPTDPVVEGCSSPEDILLGDDQDTVAAREEDESWPGPQEPAAGTLDGLELVTAAQPATPDGPRLPDFLGMTKRQVRLSVGALRLNWDLQGAGRVVAQDPPAGTLLREVALCRLVFSNEPVSPQNETQPIIQPARM